jgi:hypothetical protein
MPSVDRSDWTSRRTLVVWPGLEKPAASDDSYHKIAGRFHVTSRLKLAGQVDARVAEID